MSFAVIGQRRSVGPNYHHPTVNITPSTRAVEKSVLRVRFNNKYILQTNLKTPEVQLLGFKKIKL